MNNIETVIIPRLRAKYRDPKPRGRAVYRSRTGPKCCNASCGAKRKPYQVSGIKKERQLLH